MPTKLVKTDAGYQYGDYIRKARSLTTGWIVEYRGESIAREHTRDEAMKAAERHDHGFWWSRCEDFAETLDAIDPDLSREAQVSEVIRLVVSHGITVSDFIEMDERPGQFHVNRRSYTAEGSFWHFRLRMTRNHPDAPLFDSFKEATL